MCLIKLHQTIYRMTIIHHQSTIQNEESQDNRLMAMLIYLLSLFTGIIGPLIIWLLKRKESRLVDVSGKRI